MEVASPALKCLLTSPVSRVKIRVVRSVLTSLRARLALSAIAISGCAAEEKCIEHRTSLRADEVPSTSYFIYSAQDVVDAVAGSYEAPSRTGSGEPVSTVLLTIGTEIAGVVLVESDANPDFEEREIVHCYDRIEIDVPVTFKTADGRFDEAWDVQLVASGPDPEYASFDYDFTGQKLDGSFVPALSGDGSLDAILVSAHVSASRFFGSIIAHVAKGESYELEQWDTE